ncbi:MAG: hypothetical protein AAB645_01460 [Patescibacteria group bacterium]
MEESKKEEIKDLLEKNLKVSEENNDLLKGIIRHSRWSLALTIIKWVIIVGVTLGAYYYFEPLWNKTMDLYRSIIESTSTTSDVKTDQVKNNLNLIRLSL